MAIRKKREVFATLKADDEPNFESVEIMDVKDIETRYGDKLVLTIDDGETKFDVFCNQTSENNLIDSFGENDKDWIGKFVKITTEEDEKYKKKMIVITAI
jgi:hypothetical protein